MNLARISLLAVLAIAGVAVGFVVAVSLLVAINAIWPFGPGDDDTPREHLALALSYASWAVSAIVVFLVGWRRLFRSRR